MFLIIALLIPLFAFIYKSQGRAIPFLSEQTVTPKLVNTTRSENTLFSDHPKVYSLILNYNQDAKETKELQELISEGDTPMLLPEEPTYPKDIFKYRIELASIKGDIIQKGWMFTSLDKNLTLNVQTDYQPNSVLKIFTADNQPIFSKIIK